MNIVRFGSSGELVEMREAADALFGAPRLRDVARDAAVARERAVAVEHRLAGEADEAPLAVDVAHGLRQVAKRLARRVATIAREVGFADDWPGRSRRAEMPAAERSRCGSMPATP